MNPCFDNDASDGQAFPRYDNDAFYNEGNLNMQIKYPLNVQIYICISNYYYINYYYNYNNLFVTMYVHAQCIHSPQWKMTSESLFKMDNSEVWL